MVMVTRLSIVSIKCKGCCNYAKMKVINMSTAIIKLLDKG